MAAEEITPTYTGGTIANASVKSTTSAGLVMGFYQATCTENGDWILLPEFEAIKAVFPVNNASGVVRSATAVSVITFSTTAITFTTGGANTYNMIVVGTQAKE